MTDDRIEQADRQYERAVFDGDAGGLADADAALDAVEADLALARGRLHHARYLTDRHPDPTELALFERAAALYEALDDSRGHAEALFWIGTYHQVVRGDNDTAVPVLDRARALAADPLTLSYVLRHLGIAAHQTDDLDTAREYLLESTRLRRAVGFLPGVAANLVGLAYLAGPGEAALTILAEADAIAQSTGAAAIAGQIDEARTALSGS